MGFAIAQKTLERLEWTEVLRRLADLARTPQARERIAPAPDRDAGSLFEADAAGVAERLAETREAHAALAQGDAPPLGGVAVLAGTLARARKGGVLAPDEILEVGSTLGALADTARYLKARGESLPRLAEWGHGIEEERALRFEIEASLDRSGEVRDDASAALADARRDSNRLASEIQSRIAKSLNRPEISSHLSDQYWTVRNDRYVLPVRADSRGAVQGIVHDASRSGTTLFIEPQELVDLNNRRKRAEIAIEQETQRVLQDLTQGVADAADAIERGLTIIASVDLAFARARLARTWEAVEPEVRDEGVVHLPELRHPLIPADEVVPNDLSLGQGWSVLVLSGPNAGGKTVALKAVALAALCVRAGLFVPAGVGARVDLFDAVLADIGDEQDIREHLSTFSAHMANVGRIVAVADAHALVVLDELGVGTDPGEGAAIAQATLEALADAGARVVVTTHYRLLKEMADVDERFANASVEFDPETLAPTYRLRMGFAGSSSATAVAARMGVPGAVLERAGELLSREDRRLDGMLAELGASRAALEHEQREARRLREETESVRAEYTRRLEKLKERRDRIYREMRGDLDRAFRQAHEEIAGVVRDLQREGSAQRAARARDELLDLAERTREAEQRVGGAPEPERAARPLDWSRARPGDPVVVVGSGPATLVALPDRRGRVAVRLGSARVMIPRERVGAPDAASSPPPARRAAPAPLPAGGSRRCDLRGLRVEEALDRLVAELDGATSAGCERLVIVHGVGTGALRRAVQEHLGQSPYVARHESGDPEEGGDGVTTAVLR